QRKSTQEEVAMRKWRFIYAATVVGAAVVGFGIWNPLQKAVAHGHDEAPRYKVDPFWPKPLPFDNERNPLAATDGYRATGPGATKGWITGEVAGNYCDSHDHTFIVTRAGQGNLVSPETVVGTPTPAVVEFDREGNTVNAWPPIVPAPAAPWWAQPM